MTSQTNNSQTESRTVFGYELKECIGRGGYGEVWRAEAPGGILKAVKIVYGFHDELRAQNELKALNRIKGLRHPFLLSLERIEVSDGRLIIVNELAEMSLKDRFEQCRENGEKGICREELLTYMRDAADALDYICNTHSLQHLDIKPENLLLVSGHIKVGDFGLVKEIHNIDQSFMAGLTPVYAPPETFDGSPSTKSDQYSLAIVFQEMLTGQRPFPGSTAAQLATQHVHNQPNLDSLSRGDRQVVGRALEKAPDNRYPTCKAFVEDLINRSLRGTGHSPKQAATPTRSERTTGDINSITATLQSTLMLHDECGDIRNLPPITNLPEDVAVRPTIFLGVGRTSIKALRHLRRLLSERFGNILNLPSIRLLGLDSDMDDLNASTKQDSIDHLSFTETLGLPLRMPKDYRNDANLELSWLSRRWIYNVPRSLKTEGIRPLGRLALVDHHQRLFDKLHDMVEEMISPESLAETSESTGMNVADLPPRVFILSSISGGIGSGIAIDLAYMVRSVLIEQGKANAEINGIFSYSSGGSASHKDLAIANAFAFLTELYHYTQNGYPGDPACKIPEFQDDCPPFNNTYLCDMIGETLTDEFDHAISSMAEYMYMSAVSRCSNFFDACRQTRSIGLTFGSFGLGYPARITENSLANPITSVCQQILMYWLGKTTSIKGTADVFKLVDRTIQRCGFTFEGIALEIQQVATNKFQCTTEKALDDFLTKFCLNSDLSDQGLVARFIEEVERILTSGSIDRNDMFNTALKYALDERVDGLIKNYGDPIIKRIESIFDMPSGRIFGTRTAADYFDKTVSNQIQLLRSTRQDLDASMRTLLSQIRNRIAKLADAGEARPVDSEFQVLLSQYIQARTHIFFITYVERVLKSVSQYVATKISNKLQVWTDLLNRLYTRFESCKQNSAILAAASIEQPPEIQTVIVRQLMDRWHELVQKVDNRIQPGQLKSLLEDETFEVAVVEDLRILIHQFAQSTVAETLKEIDYNKIIETARFDGIKIAEWLKPHLQLALPNLLNRCGGDVRLLLAVPDHTGPGFLSECLQKQFDYLPTVVQATHGNVTICLEAEGIELKRVLLRLIRERPECVELANRLNTRTDVNWTSIQQIIS